MVGEQRPVVAVDALRLADEQAQALQFSAGQAGVPRVPRIGAGDPVPLAPSLGAGSARHRLQQIGDIAVEAALAGQQQPLVGGDGLGGVDEHLRYRLDIGDAGGFPFRQRRQGTEQGGVSRSVFRVGGDQTGDGGAAGALLDGVFQG